MTDSDILAPTSVEGRHEVYRDRSHGRPHARSRIHDLYHDIVQEIHTANEAKECFVCLSKNGRSCLKESLSMLYLWAQGLDLNHFEQHVDQGTGMQQLVIRILQDIQHLLRSGECLRDVVCKVMT